MDTSNPCGLIAPALILGGCMMVGLIAGGSLLGAQIKAIRLAVRYVTVKGLVERTVKSDSGIWPVNFKEAGNDLPKVFEKSEADKTAVLKFLADHGVTAQEVTVGQIDVTDTEANQYVSNKAPSRYIVSQTGLSIHRMSTSWQPRRKRPPTWSSRASFSRTTVKAQSPTSSTA